MGATLAAFAAVQIVMPLWIRPHLAASATADIAFTPGTLAELRFLACRVYAVMNQADEAIAWLLNDERNLRLGWLSSAR
ncbi:MULTISPECIES: hypothetical protein [Streptomyces violaceusniger group]|nr:hypothetical protein [Streptomyces javensis]